MTTPETVVIVSAKRTPIGSFMGSLAPLNAPQLGSTAIKTAVENSGINPSTIDEVYMGCVLSAGLGQAPARQAAIGAGISTAAGAVTINKVCGSGLQAIYQGWQSLLTQQAQTIVAGGMESMSNVPHLLPNSRNGYKLGHQQLLDALVHDGLWDPYNNKHMGSCTEEAAKKYGFTQAEQDAFAINSYQKALNSINQKLFTEEIATIEITRKKETITIDTDEEPLKGDIQKLPNLKPVFEKDGTITAGNASTLNDGAAAVVMTTESTAQKTNLKPLCRIIAIARHSQEPLWFSTAPVGAIEKVLAKANLSIVDIDCFEINEAFSAVTMAAIKELNIEAAKVNPRGGAVALGHPIGATGTRLVVTLAHTLKQNNQRYGLAALCIGGGEALAIIIENLM